MELNNRHLKEAKRLQQLISSEYNNQNKDNGSSKSVYNNDFYLRNSKRKH